MNYTPHRTSTSSPNRYTALPYPWWNRLTLNGTITRPT